jgi:hypothetical protein
MYSLLPVDFHRFTTSQWAMHYTGIIPVSGIEPRVREVRGIWDHCLIPESIIGPER